MRWRVLRSGRLSKSGWVTELVTLFELITAVFYDDAVVANGYDDLVVLCLPLYGQASRVTGKVK